MTTPTITKRLIKLPAAGKGVLSWIAIDGQQVETGAPIARFIVGTPAHTIMAPCTGRLSRTTPDNTTLMGGSVVGWVSEGEQGTAAPTPQKPLQAAAAVSGPNTRTATEARNPPQQVQAAAPKIEASTEPRTRRGSHIEAATLAAAVVELPGDVGKKGQKRASKKTVNRTYSIGDHQEADIARLAKTLQLEALSDDSIPPANESELVRAAVDLLLGLPRPALLDVLKANREREKAGKWGRGRPRPGK